MYTVKQLSSLAGVSVRTLHYYDEIGLLKPSSVGKNGYRYYTDAALFRLQQILFFREMDLDLPQIKQILEGQDFDLVTALQSHRQRLQEKIDRLQTLIHVLYEDFGLGEIDPYGRRTAINLYGPPGTGKSFAVEAIAHELGMGIIRANYAEIESKYVGETAKNIKAAFQKAKETNALLFFDEADSILGRRLSNITQSSDHAVNVSRSVMLLELDHFPGVTVFATNLASNYDTAFIRRILGHIEMPLPNADCRSRLWQRHIPSRLPVQLNNGDWDSLVSETEGLAGGDILNIVVYATSLALEREGLACRITLNDFLLAIEASKRAKQAVGVPKKSDARTSAGVGCTGY